ncbi:MAG TPA: molybdopterin-binding protein [Anaeromyxobacteraceae bacterium]|nr:molybdopterin-binding protein [Anaeromyxobacteraceae bacterium]
MTTPSAALVIVGTEVLSAKIHDENGPWAAERLQRLGVRLASISTIPDDLAIITETVARERSRVDWVFTSGGVGPTHDDVTVAAVARALGVGIRRNPELAAILREGHRRWQGTDIPEAALRMADVPEGTRLEGDPGYPVLVVQNVVMLPGVPRFFRAQFEGFAARLAAAPFRLASVYVKLTEDCFAVELERVQSEYADVQIGSYPRFDDGVDHRVRLTFESKDPARVMAARDAFLARIPVGAVVRDEGP